VSCACEVRRSVDMSRNVPTAVCTSSRSGDYCVTCAWRSRSSAVRKIITCGRWIWCAPGAGILGSVTICCMECPCVRLVRATASDGE
jgi:hypothetical protein